MAPVRVGALVTAALRLTPLRAGIVLIYHRVGDPGSDYTRELSPKLATDLFDAQMRYVRRFFKPVRASELHAAVARRALGERFPLAVTFDDDELSHLEVSAPILARNRLAATFFLNGASLERPFRFWWDLLQVAVDRGVADAPLSSAISEPELAGEPGDIHVLGMAVQMLPSAERDHLAERLQEAVGDLDGDAGLRAGQVGELAARGFEIGFHTRRHDFLPELGDDELAAAMSDGRGALERAAGTRVSAIAYPHGGFDERVTAAARAAGFESGFTTREEAVTDETDTLAMGRIEGSYESLGHFALKLARALVRARSGVEMPA
jgi:peptidoglycan/xylan/chitin deacetylase (PgdA/CDA1 family)